MFSKISIILISVIIIANEIKLIYGSIGDRLPVYRNCLNECLQSNCSDSNALEFYKRQPNYLLLMGWDCSQECQHQCQWTTIKTLIDSGLHYKQLPQFYGKWTFIRIYGIQEPASVLFSLLNLLTNYYGWKKYMKNTKSDPYFKVWTFQTVLSINAWFWSTIFHIHETSISEKLDYFSAYSVVIYSLCALTIKVLDNQLIGQIDLKIHHLVHLAIAMPFLAFFLYHIHYLFFIHFDYGYNMRVNVYTGILSSIGWLFWSYTNRHKGKYIWKCVLSLLLLNLLLLLEVNDFPPIAFIFDAHSLWHLGTIPIPLVWFSFLTDEANYTPDNKLDCDYKKNNLIDCT